MDAFHAAMAAVNVSPLWEREARITKPEPAHVWRWRELDPLIDQAVKATSMTEAERRVLMLNNPVFREGEQKGANVNLSVNLQVLMPGESARPHRHTMNALRFVLEGEGVTTIVEGKPCPMLPGDMLLTPGWTWHEHHHKGSKRCVWVDALDVPFHDYMRNAVFEPGPSHDITPLPADEAFNSPGLVPQCPVATPYSPLFRYPWESAVRALASLPAAPDGSRRLRYTNPVTGGATMATLDCDVLQLGKGQATRAERTNGNIVCVVVEGEGESTIGDDVIGWGRYDIFTVPRNAWASHKAIGGTARIFRVNDFEMLRRLDLFREETRQN
jgi:gentisate 1,2-dioxygenase